MHRQESKLAKRSRVFRSNPQSYSIKTLFSSRPVFRSGLEIGFPGDAPPLEKSQPMPFVYRFHLCSARSARTASRPFGFGTVHPTPNPSTSTGKTGLGSGDILTCVLGRNFPQSLDPHTSAELTSIRVSDNLSIEETKIVGFIRKENQIFGVLFNLSFAPEEPVTRALSDTAPLAAYLAKKSTI